MIGEKLAAAVRRSGACSCFSADRTRREDKGVDSLCCEGRTTAATQRRRFARQRKWWAAVAFRGRREELVRANDQARGGRRVLARGNHASATAKNGDIVQVVAGPE